jgi:hypothetical protein
MMRSMRRRQSARTLPFRRGRSGVADDFKDQRRFEDGDGGVVASEDFVHPAALRLDHGRMHDGVQLLQAALTKGEIGEAGAVEATVGPTTSGRSA